MPPNGKQGGRGLQKTWGKVQLGRPSRFHRAVGVLWEQIPGNAASQNFDFSALGLPHPEEAEGHVQVVKLEIDGVFHMPRIKGSRKCAHLKLLATGFFW